MFESLLKRFSTNIQPIYRNTWTDGPFIIEEKESGQFVLIIRGPEPELFEVPITRRSV